MAVLLSNIDAKSQDFARNAEAMRRAVEDLRDRLAKATRGGTDEARARHTKRG
jgi:3-methylcrotonyl-CoA carboxylase beta subunit